MLRVGRVALVLAALASATLVACKQEGTQPPPDGGDGEEATLPTPGAVERAQTLLAAGRAEEALAVFDGAINETPQDHELHYGRGVALQALGRNDEAVTAWREALRLKPGFFPALNGIGAVLLDAGRFEEAVVALGEAIAAKPDFPDARYNLALAYEGLGKIPEAIAALGEARRLAPQDYDVLVALATLHLKAGDAAAAHEAAVQASEVRKGEVEAVRLDAMALARLGRHADAAAALELVVAKAPEDAESRLSLARELSRAGRPEAALPHLARLAKERPNEALVWSEWGAAEAKAGRLDGPDGALAKLRRALELDPKLASAHVRLVAALADARRCKEANAALKAFAATSPRAEARSQAEAAAKACKP